jgi:hypothetical protein
MSFDDLTNRVRCDTCGRFMRYREPGSSAVFVPDSAMSYEENREQCAACTKKYGKLMPNQNVVAALYSWVY